MTASQVFTHSAVSIEALVEGSGPPVVMIASLGRPAQDFDDLAHRVAVAGHAAVRLQPRGIGKSSGPMSGLSLADLAGDVAMVIERLGSGPAVLVGHAFGQRVARMLATMRADLVKGVVMLAAGGKVPIPQRAREAVTGCFDLTLKADAHLENVRYAFFAPGSDPAVWRAGWHPEVAKMQMAATRGVGPEGNDAAAGAHPPGTEAWWAGGSVPLLVIQGLQDTVALPENGRQLTAAFGDRVELIEIDGAGHALLPEQPERIAAGVLAFLSRLERAGNSPAQALGRRSST
jgi:pimeloyl-ACP methyl ester carboxylesterase